MPDEFEQARNEAVAAWLRFLAGFLGLSQKEFSEHLGIPRDRLAKAFQGVSRPGVKDALRVCRVHHVTLDWIYAGKRDLLPIEFVRALEAADGQSSEKRARIASIIEYHIHRNVPAMREVARKIADEAASEIAGCTDQAEDA